MKILFVSPHGKGLSLAYRLNSEGHELALHGPFHDLHDTFSLSTDLEGDAKAADLVIFDGPGKGIEADALRRQKIRVWGGGELADRFDSDQEFALDAAAKLGIETVLPILPVLSAPPLTTAEITFEGWFGGQKDARFAFPYNWTIQDRHLLTGGLGPEVDYIGSVSRNIQGGTVLAGEAFLKPLEPLLRASGYSGPVRVSTGFLANGRGYVASIRLGIAPEPTLALFPKLGNAINECQMGSGVAGGHGAYGYAAALRLYVATPIPDPFTAPEGFIPHRVRIEDGKMTLTESPIVGVTLGKSGLLDKATAQCVWRARQVSLPGLSYRLDIGHRVPKIIAKLDSTGWLR